MDCRRNPRLIGSKASTEAFIVLATPYAFAPERLPRDAKLSCPGTEAGMVLSGARETRTSPGPSPAVLSVVLSSMI